MTEDRRWKAEGRRQRTDGREQRTEDRTIGYIGTGLC